ncbi:AT-rich interactive domain-containing protein 3A [Galdieria sulphuraria]|nr:AT-rich interactive domain-containing protein 3A [Galdieria sulphuraria]
MNQQEGLQFFQGEYKQDHVYLPHTGWKLHNSYWTPTPAYSYYPLYLVNGQPNHRNAIWEGYSIYPEEYKVPQGISTLHSQEAQSKFGIQVSHTDPNKESDIYILSKDHLGNVHEEIRTGNTSPCSGSEQPLVDTGQNNHIIEPVHAFFEECSNCSTTSSSFRSSMEEMRNEGKQNSADNSQRNAPSNSTSRETKWNCDTEEESHFYQSLYELMSRRGQPILRLPTLGFKELDLFRLFKEVTSRGGVDYVIAKKQWKEVADALGLPSSCTDSGFRLRLHYIRYLEPYERTYFTPPPDIINSLFKYRGRKLGNLYSNQRAKHHTNRKKCISKSPSMERPVRCVQVTGCEDKMERNEPCNTTSPKRRKYPNRKTEEQLDNEIKQLNNNSSRVPATFQVDNDFHQVNNCEMDSSFLTSSPDECSNRDKSIRLFDRIGECSLMRYVDRYLNKRCSELTNVPRQNLVHMAEEHFQIVCCDNKLSCEDF